MEVLHHQQGPIYHWTSRYYQFKELIIIALDADSKTYIMHVAI